MKNYYTKDEVLKLIDKVAAAGCSIRVIDVLPSYTHYGICQNGIYSGYDCSSVIKIDSPNRIPWTKLQLYYNDEPVDVQAPDARLVLNRYEFSARLDPGWSFYSKKDLIDYDENVFCRYQKRVCHIDDSGPYPWDVDWTGLFVQTNEEKQS